jgi:hypothetical protein
MAVISPSVPIMSLFVIYLLLIALAALQRERAPFARALGVVAGQAQDLESLKKAVVPKPAVHATCLGISADQLIACTEAPPRRPKPQQARGQP